MTWTVETLNETVDAELADLPTDNAGAAGPDFGVDRSRRPAHRQRAARPPRPRPALGDPPECKAGIARALYVTAKEQRVVIVRAFIKKTEKTPTGEIELALQRAKELKP
jgi:Phage derived protein Gp49-like (DUF891)